jgi:hypothetical protein
MPAEADLSSEQQSVKVHRTPGDILARIDALASGGEDYFGFQGSDLIEFLPFQDAERFLKPEVTEAEWNLKTPDEDTVKALILDYMPFAWGKANDCRGLSASRSIEHMKTWLWLLGDDLGEKLSDIYQFYGKPCLRLICEKYRWDWRQWDDGCWRNSEDDDGIAPPAARTEEPTDG